MATAGSIQVKFQETDRTTGEKTRFSVPLGMVACEGGGWCFGGAWGKSGYPT